MNKCEIHFFHRATFPKLAERARDLRVFGHDGDTAGLAVEAIDQVPALSQVQPHAPDQTRHLARLGWMTDQPRRLVQHQQILVFTKDVQNVGHVLQSFESRSLRTISGKTAPAAAVRAKCALVVKGVDCGLISTTVAPLRNASKGNEAAG